MQNYGRESLADIREVLSELEETHFDTQEDKIRAYMKMVNYNPREYMVGPVYVKTSYAGTMAIEDCFANFLAAM